MGHPQQGMSALGTRIANLVLEFDNEKGYEFRVQCEVPIAPADAEALGTQLASHNIARLTEAKELVLRNVTKGATEGFIQMVKDAFDQNIARLQS